MADLATASEQDSQFLMLGSGTPAHISEVQQYFHASMRDLLADPDAFAHAVGDYDPAQGNTAIAADPVRTGKY